MNNIVQVAQNADAIIKGKPVTCPCGERWFSPFDKLYVRAYNKCSTCSSPDELDRLSDNIFNIIETL